MKNAALCQIGCISMDLTRAFLKKKLSFFGEGRRFENVVELASCLEGLLLYLLVFGITSSTIIR